MPRKPIDYSRTHFYKIVCKNIEINDAYIGHTTDFITRKNNHKRTCYKETDRHYNIPLYQFIRENGGFDNFEMILIKTLNCENSLEARQKEREFIEELKPTLNKVIPYISVEEAKERAKQWQIENREHLKEYRTNYYEENQDRLQKQHQKYREEHKEEKKEYLKKYYEEHKDDLKEYHKQYYEGNREDLRVYRANYYQKNKDIHREQHKKYLEENQEEIKRKNAEKVECDCGSVICRGAKANHVKSFKHQDLLKNKI